MHLKAATVHAIPPLTCSSVFLSILDTDIWPLIRRATLESSLRKFPWATEPNTISVPAVGEAMHKKISSY